MLHHNCRLYVAHGIVPICYTVINQVLTRTKEIHFASLKGMYNELKLIDKILRKNIHESRHDLYCVYVVRGKLTDREARRL